MRRRVRGARRVRATVNRMDGSRRDPFETVGAAAPFHVEFEQLTMLGKLAHDDADERLPADRVMRVLVGSGRGCVLQGSDLPPMVVVPLRGSVRVTDTESARLIRRGQSHRRGERKLLPVPQFDDPSIRFQSQALHVRLQIRMIDQAR